MTDARHDERERLIAWERFRALADPDGDPENYRRLAERGYWHLLNMVEVQRILAALDAANSRTESYRLYSVRAEERLANATLQMGAEIVGLRATVAKLVMERDDWKAKALAANAEAFEASAERDAVAFEIRDYRYMDPPDGGDPSLAEMVGRLWKDMEAKKAERDALRAQLAAAQADTERLDWLEDFARKSPDGLLLHALRNTQRTGLGIEFRTLAKAIDAARATKESKDGE